MTRSSPAPVQASDSDAARRPSRRPAGTGQGQAQGARAARPRGKPARAFKPEHPVLQQLAQWYPRLFGEQPAPLKRGIFEDLMNAHPEALEREGLKAAMALHTRSTRYLSSVASGQKRHDLQGQAVEAVAPEHVLHALLEVHRRRQARADEDLTPKLRARLVQAFEASGLSREDYAALFHSRDATLQAVFDEALSQAAAQAARDEALHRAYLASGLAPEAFADSYGLAPAEVLRMLARAARSTPAG
jgi:ProP effector